MKIYTQRQLAELQNVTINTIVNQSKKWKYQLFKTFDCFQKHATFYIPTGKVVKVGEEVELVNPCWVKQGKGLEVEIKGKTKSYALPEDCRLMK